MYNNYSHVDFVGAAPGKRKHCRKRGDRTASGTHSRHKCLKSDTGANLRIYRATLQTEEGITSTLAVNLRNPRMWPQGMKSQVRICCAPTLLLGGYTARSSRRMVRAQSYNGRHVTSRHPTLTVIYVMIAGQTYLGTIATGNSNPRVESTT